MSEELETPCGYLDIEDEEDSNHFVHRYFVLDYSKSKLLYYPDDLKNYPYGADPSPTGSINLQYVSTVTCAKEIRPKLDNCFVINITGKRIFLCAPTFDEMTSWVENLNNACKISVPKGSEKNDIMSEDKIVKKKKLSATLSDQSVQSQTEIDSSGDELEFNYPLREAKAIRQGYCVKQGGVVKSWKRRWFVLDEFGITYYKSENAKLNKKSPLGFININDIVEVKEAVGVHTKRHNLFGMVTTNRIFYLQCDSPEEMSGWLDAIQSAVCNTSTANSSSEYVDAKTATGTYTKLPWT